MKKSNNIDKIFKDQFKGAEITPPEDIWTDISSKLPLEKRSKRIIPLWYYIGGTVAALFIIALLIRNTFDTPTIPKVTNTKEILNENENSGNRLNTTKSSNFIPNENKTKVASSKYSDIQNSKNTSSSNNNKSKENSQSQLRGKDNYAIINSKEEQISKSAKFQNRTALNTVINNNGIKPGTNSNIIASNNLAPSISDVEQVVKDDEKDKLDSPKDEITGSKRFSISANAAALYYDNFGKGSSLSNQIASDNNGMNSTSYGVTIGYQISKNIKIRSGVNQIALSNNLQDVSFASVLNSSNISDNFSDTNTPENGNSADVFVKIDQNIGFIEVPAEIEYFILNKKFGVSFISGFSTLILNKNKISIASADTNFSSKVANLNNLSFTANLGIGFNYEILPSFQLNIEPILKYQLNTFTKTSSYKPYYFGFYSGLSYKF